MMVLVASWPGLWKEDLAPRKHMIAESSSEKAILQRINSNVLLFGCLSVLERRLASLLNGTVGDRPQPLLEETIGVKEPCSTSMNLF